MRCIIYRPLTLQVISTHENTFLHYVRKRNHK